MNRTKLCLSLLLAGMALQPAQTVAMEKLAKVAAAGSLATAGYHFANYLNEKKIHPFDWNKIDPTQIRVYQTDPGLDFPEWSRKEPFDTISIANFLKARARYLAKHLNLNTLLLGAAGAAHQVESGNVDTQWNLFEAQEQDENGNWIAPVVNGQPVKLDGNVVCPVGLGCDAQNHEDEDIALMKEFGLNSYRLSIAWEKIYPQPGVINQEEVARYRRFFKKLVDNNIRPVVTLYHYAEPQWFYELGGFEKTQNIKHFVEFCTTVYKEFHSEVYLWFTFNAPEGIALQGWLTGAKPPAKKDMKLAVQVLHNILEAHVAVYRAIKALPEIGSKSQVGILKNILQLDPWNIFNPLDHLACMFGNRLQNESVYNFLTTGDYSVSIPGKVSYTATNDYIKNGGKCLDFIGLNYYSHNYMKNFKTIAQPNHEIEPATRNERYTVYGEGLYRAIQELSNRIAKPLQVPIYITENGVPTTNDEQGNALRTLHNQRYLYGMARAIQEGHDVRGYIHWALMDNYEWGSYRKFYGLHHVDRSTPELKRTIKDGARYYQSIAKGAAI